MQSDKWTVEGAVKAGFPVSILQRSASVTGEGCVGTLLKCAESYANQGGTAGLQHYCLSLYIYRDRLFYLARQPFPTKNFQGDKMLNLSLDEVKAYAADYTAVPVAKECFADMVTRNR